jgi:hypothetical protein
MLQILKNCEIIFYALVSTQGQEVEFHEIEIQLFHEVEIDIFHEIKFF